MGHQIEETSALRIVDCLESAIQPVLATLSGCQRHAESDTESGLSALASSLFDGMEGVEMAGAERGGIEVTKRGGIKVQGGTSEVTRVRQEVYILIFVRKISMVV